MANSKILRYITDQPVSMALGNTTSYVKPTIQLVYDTDGASGKYGNTISIIPPNIFKTYIPVYIKYNEQFDITTNGNIVLNNKQLLRNDVIWLANQTNPLENGIYTYNGTNLTNHQAINDNMFIDLGAIAYDKLDGDLTRNIIVDHNINFAEVGFYTITYYVINSKGVLSKTYRKVKILQKGASITPTNTIKITDYKIKPDVDPSLLISNIPNTTNLPEYKDINSIDISLFIKKDGSVKFENDQSMNNKRLTGLANPLYGTDAVNLQSLINLINSPVVYSYKAGEPIYEHNIVYLATNGNIYNADNTDLSQKNRIIGIAINTANAGESVDIIRSGLLSGFTKLNTGLSYYLTNNASISYIEPDQGFKQLIGIAVSDTDLLIDFTLSTINGATGSQGSQGYIGSQGMVGDRGAQGAIGAQGATGNTGAQGAVGVQGIVGVQGNQGNVGATGAQGATGNTGAQGVIGVQGNQGNQGNVGVTGAQGATGNAGVQGVIGVQGNQGNTGAQGATGNAGVQGVIGVQGNQGNVGVTGAQGATGNAGVQGVIGVQGNQGNVGVTGAQGATGNVGAQGAVGNTGAQGAIGYQGNQGNVGTTGAQGAIGYQGVQGASGSGNGSVTQNISNILTNTITATDYLIRYVGNSDISYELPSATGSHRFIKFVHSGAINTTLIINASVNGSTLNDDNGVQVTKYTSSDIIVLEVCDAELNKWVLC